MESLKVYGKNSKLHELGKIVILNILQQTKIKPKFIDEVIMGQVLTGGTGQNPARQAAIAGGIPIEKTAYCNKSSLWFGFKIYCCRLSINSY